MEGRMGGWEDEEDGKMDGAGIGPTGTHTFRDESVEKITLGNSTLGNPALYTILPKDELTSSSNNRLDQ